MLMDARLGVMTTCLQGCHAGLLQHQDLAANKGISAALNSIMRQLSGLDTEACDMEVKLIKKLHSAVCQDPALAWQCRIEHEHSPASLFLLM